VHRHSPRAENAFIKLNCAALQPTLVESELFSHEKGTLTGATEKRKGRFELADGGTIFLDEVSEIPLELQAKLLCFLQEGQFERVGGAETRKVDVRVIAATNRRLNEAVVGGKFRNNDPETIGMWIADQIGEGPGDLVHMFNPNRSVCVRILCKDWS